MEDKQQEIIDRMESEIEDLKGKISELEHEVQDKDEKIDNLKSGLEDIQRITRDHV